MIFVDSSFWIALRNRRDGLHETAVALARRHGDTPLLTTNHVRAETWTFLRRRMGHGPAVHFLDSIRRSPRVRAFFVAPQLEEQAEAWLRRHDERPYSFVDATSFAVMRSLRIKDALAFDGDFSAAGFRELRA